MLLSFFKNHGVLGINARNLLYVRPYNKKRAIRLADSKLQTKYFLSARGIQVPKLFFAIKSRKELQNFDFDVLPESFVLKPNFGYGGEGIIPIVAKEDDKFIKPNGEVVTKEMLFDHISDILDGRYSISNVADIAFFEQRVICDERIGRFAYKGLPDIRVVVYNLVPVMAMLRLPTRESDGKANLHLGAVGVGIDLAKGMATHIVKANKIIEEIPGIGGIRGLKIPYWEEILLIASRIQLATNLGYLAADIVLDKTVGPVLLEINARAGLGVQVANLAPLRRRLEKIKGIRVSRPEKGVRLSQDMFGEKVEREIKNISGKQIIGAVEPIEIIIEEGIFKQSAQINPMAINTTVDRVLAHKIGLLKDDNKDLKTIRLKFVLKNIRVVTVAEIVHSNEKSTEKVQIGNRDLRDFLIDPSLTADQTIHLPSEKSVVRDVKKDNYHESDRKLLEYDNEIKLLYHLKPLNLVEEEKKFLMDNKYNPQFIYPELKFNIYELRKNLESLKFDDSPLGKIFFDKKEELKKKIDLLESIGRPEFTESSIKLFGAPGSGITWEAQQRLVDFPEQKENEKSINAEQAQMMFLKILKEYNLNNWKVKIKPDLVTSCIAGKRNALLVRKDILFSQDKIENLIIHEIETHILTAENGKYQPFMIFNRGLASYLATQEGLAVYNTLKFGKLKSKRYLINTVAVYDAMRGSFTAVFEKIRTYGLPIDIAYQITLKVKRGLTDTSLSGAFTKDFVYFSGLKEIENFVNQKGDLKKLYIGKINLADLNLIEKISGLVPPKYLPKWLK